MQSMSRTEPLSHEPAPEETGTRAQHMLLSFLREHDAPCPVCGYNLHALTRPICPECGHDLVLTVGTTRVHLGWLLASVAPGFFSGIAACFVLVMIVARLIFGDRKMSIGLNAVDLFGWCSGAFAIILAIQRSRFLAQPRTRQRWFALAVWLIHIGAFVLLILLGPRYL